MSIDANRSARRPKPYNPAGWLLAAAILGIIPALWPSRAGGPPSVANPEAVSYMLGVGLGLLVRAMVYGGVAWLIVWAIFVRRRLSGSLDKGFIVVGAVFVALLVQWLVAPHGR